MVSNGIAVHRTSVVSNLVHRTSVVSNLVHRTSVVSNLVHRTSVVSNLVHRTSVGFIVFSNLVNQSYISGNSILLFY